MASKDRTPVHLIATIAFTAVLLGLIALAIGGSSPAIAVWAVVSAAVLAAAFHFLIPGSTFFTVIFANCIGIYACLYSFLSTTNFTAVPSFEAQIGFVAPLVTFALGVIWRRQAIREIVQGHHGRLDTELIHAFLWIAPLVLIGVATFVVPLDQFSPAEQGTALLLAMGLVSVLAFMASRDIAVFLIDTGILFEDFSANASRLVKPAFAFFTWYSLLVIVFACLYTIIDRFSPATHFIVSGEVRNIQFSEALYVSVVTLSTVGYGDIVAHTPAARMLVALEIFVGVLLLLFGVQAILAPTVQRQPDHKQRD
ncbi:MAG: ion channel [Rhodospirillaceae bacterium]|nr:ion channel [Rhodospirillaceae bacterium]